MVTPLQERVLCSELKQAPIPSVLTPPSHGSQLRPKSSQKVKWRWCWQAAQGALLAKSQ